MGMAEEPKKKSAGGMDELKTFASEWRKYKLAAIEAGDTDSVFVTTPSIGEYKGKSFSGETRGGDQGTWTQRDGVDGYLDSKLTDDEMQDRADRTRDAYDKHVRPKGAPWDQELSDNKDSSSMANNARKAQRNFERAEENKAYEAKRKAEWQAEYEAREKRRPEDMRTRHNPTAEETALNNALMPGGGIIPLSTDKGTEVRYDKNENAMRADGQSELRSQDFHEGIPKFGERGSNGEFLDLERFQMINSMNVSDDTTWLVDPEAAAGWEYPEGMPHRKELFRPSTMTHQKEALLRASNGRYGASGYDDQGSPKGSWGPMNYTDLLNGPYRTDKLITNQRGREQSGDTERRRREKEMGGLGDLRAKTDSAMGLRPDGNKKGPGFLGELKNSDGSVSTEYSTQSEAVKVDGKRVDFPTLVPTLTETERKLMTDDIIPNKKDIPEAIMQKAIKHANERKRLGYDVFFSSDEVIK